MQLYGPPHPAGMALEGTLRFVFEQRGGRESGGKEDKDLELEFRRMADGLNPLHTRLPFDVIIRGKQCNSAGLQLADLTARPLALRVLRPEQPNRAADALPEAGNRPRRGARLGADRTPLKSRRAPANSQWPSADWGFPIHLHTISESDERKSRPRRAFKQGRYLRASAAGGLAAPEAADARGGARRRLQRQRRAAPSRARRTGCVEGGARSRTAASAPRRRTRSSAPTSAASSASPPSATASSSAARTGPWISLGRVYTLTETGRSCFSLTLSGGFCSRSRNAALLPGWPMCCNLVLYARLWGACQGSNGNKKLSMRTLLDLDVPVPPLAERLALVAVLRCVGPRARRRRPPPRRLCPPRCRPRPRPARPAPPPARLHRRVAGVPTGGSVFATRRRDARTFRYCR